MLIRLDGCHLMAWDVYFVGGKGGLVLKPVEYSFHIH